MLLLLLYTSTVEGHNGDVVLFDLDYSYAKKPFHAGKAFLFSETIDLNSKLDTHDSRHRNFRAQSERT